MGNNVLPGALAGLNSAYAAICTEEVEVSRQPEGKAASGALPGRVETLTFLGARTACFVALEDGTRIVAERADLPPGLAIGDDVICRLPRNAIVPLEA